MAIGRSDSVEIQESAPSSMDWGTTRGGAGSADMQPDESLEDFLVRVGVPPAYRVDLWRFGSAVILYLRRSLDLATRSWTWSLAAVPEFVVGSGGLIVRSWTVGPDDLDRVADDIIVTARSALAVHDDEAIVVESRALAGTAKTFRTTTDDEAREAIATALAEPDRWAPSVVHAAAFRPAFLPRLGRSGPGSGMDETAATGPDASEAREGRLHLIWWEGSTRRERSWPIEGPSIAAPLANEVAVAARTILGVDEGGPVRAEASPVAGPDYWVLGDAQDSFVAFLLYSAAFGGLAGAAASVLAGLVLHLNAIPIVAGVLTSIPAAFTIAMLADLPVRIIIPPAAAEYDIASIFPRRGGGLRRLRAYKSTRVRVALGSTYVATLVIVSVAVTVLLGG